MADQQPAARGQLSANLAPLTGTGSGGGPVSGTAITAELTEQGLRVLVSARQEYDPAGRRTATSLEAGEASAAQVARLEALLREIYAAESERLLGRLARDVAQAREAAIRAGEAPGWEED